MWFYHVKAALASSKSAIIINKRLYAGNNKRLKSNIDFHQIIEGLECQPKEFGQFPQDDECANHP